MAPFQNKERRHDENDNHELISKFCSERASRRWILTTILIVHFDHSTAGVAAPQPAVFDSVIIAGRPLRSLRFYLPLVSL